MRVGSGRRGADGSGQVSTSRWSTRGFAVNGSTPVAWRPAVRAAAATAARMKNSQSMKPCEDDTLSASSPM
ncbi:hypothetical protein [Catenulispora subtropica]|uniref:hypothetical protein n=1 Tax=Catenulispora subtropica TaxID=450798 RepID=UPI0031D27C52